MPTRQHFDSKFRDAVAITSCWLALLQSPFWQRQERLTGATPRNSVIYLEKNDSSALNARSQLIGPKS